MIQGDQDAWIHANAGGYDHLASRCRMSAAGDGAVGYDLPVHGVGRLPVADASVMPRISTVNTMATTIGIAERASDLILA